MKSLKEEVYVSEREIPAFGGKLKRKGYNLPDTSR